MDSSGWNDRYATKDYVWSAEPNRFVAEHLSGLTPGRAIDLGAGEGRNAVWLAQQGWDVTAVDFSDAGLDKGRRLAADHDVSVDFVCADATTWQATEPVDLVVLSYLQLDADHQRTILRHAVEWLRPAGTVFVIAHDQSNVEHGHGGPPSEAVCYDVERTIGALDGLQISIAEVVERPVDTPDGERIALDTLVIARRPADT